MPIKIPKIPPIKQMVRASVINCSLISNLVAPIDLKVPIYRVLSVTLTSIIFPTPIAPTNSDIPAIDPKNKVNAWVT